MNNICSQNREVKVHRSAAGYYIGVFDEDGPYCRISQDYYKKESDAQLALDSGFYSERDCVENRFCNKGKGCWARKENPK